MTSMEDSTVEEDYSGVFPTPPASPKDEPTMAADACAEPLAAGAVDLTDGEQPAAAARLAKPGGFAEFNRNVPFWTKQKSFMSDLGLRLVNTRHANRNLCLCFSALVAAGNVSEAEQG